MIEILKGNSVRLLKSKKVPYCHELVGCTGEWRRRICRHYKNIAEFSQNAGLHQTLMHHKAILRYNIKVIKYLVFGFEYVGYRYFLWRDTVPPLFFGFITHCTHSLSDQLNIRFTWVSRFEQFGAATIALLHLGVSCFVLGCRAEQSGSCSDQLFSTPTNFSEQRE